MSLAKKHGVSLITVLLFMMVATIAATAVHKWLLSENRSSAARLKQSEAYQASQAGINATRAWMSYNANEAGMLVTQFLQTPPQPVSLDSILETLDLDTTAVKVALTGVDVSGATLKLKITSTGKGRDSSSLYSQIAIMNVEGLYQVKVPSVGKKANYNYAYFGGSTTYSGNHHATSMLINGDWSGNPGAVDGDFVVTGSVTLSGNNISVGGNACIGGNASTQNGVTINNLYVHGDANNYNGTIENNAYFNGDLNVGSTAAGFEVGGSMTLMGEMELAPTWDYPIGKNLCLGTEPKSKINFNGLQNGHKFTVSDSVWIPNKGSLQMTDNSWRQMGAYTSVQLGTSSNAALYVNGLNTCGYYIIKTNVTYTDKMGTDLDKTKCTWYPWGCAVSQGRTLAHDERCYGDYYGCRLQRVSTSDERNLDWASSIRSGGPDTKCPSGFYFQNHDATQEKWSNPYTDGWFVAKQYAQFKSSAASTRAKAIEQNATKLVTCAEPVKNHCDSIWTQKEGCPVAGGGPAGKARFKVDDILTTGYSKFIEKANQAQCVKDIIGMDVNKKINFNVSALNNCYASLAANADSSALRLYNGYLVMSMDNNALFNNPSGTLDGKFIFVFTSEIYQTKVPPTTNDSYVMLYLKEGAKGELLQTGSGKFNYFVYTQKDIAQIQGTEWRGSFYAEASNCAAIGNINGNTDLIYDENVINSMTDAGIICDYGTTCVAAGESSDDSSEPSGGSGGTSTSVTATGTDYQWIAYATTLKVSLATEYTNNEDLDAVENASPMQPALLVMPRVIYLTNKDKLQDNYSVLYFGGLTRASGGGSATCYEGERIGSGNVVSETSQFANPGLHSCRYSEGSYYSDFWVWISDDKVTSKVSFTKVKDEFTADECATGSVSREIEVKNSNGIQGEIKLFVYNQSSGVVIEPKEVLGNPTSVNGGTLYVLRTPQNQTTFPVFKVSINSCENASGYMQLQLQDENMMDDLGIGSPSTELFNFGESYGVVRHGSINDPKSVATPEQRDRADCFANSSTNETWAAYTSGSKACKVLSTTDKVNGPWECQVALPASLKVTTNPAYEDSCEIVTDGVETVYPSDANDVTLYASLKKKQYTLHVNVNGLKGSAETYSDDNDAEVQLEDGRNGTLLGTCKVGSRGTCDFTVTHGVSYFVKAVGSNFSGWEYTCDASVDCSKSFFIERSNILSIKPRENITVDANFYKAGVCFNEDFKNLYSYCDHSVTPNVLKGYYKKNEKFDDWGYGENAYCIDQCVTDETTRPSSENYTKYGQDPWHYDVYCSMDGEANKLSYYDPNKKEYVYGGGYYPQDDPYAVWLKVVMRNGFYQTRGTLYKGTGNDYGGWWNAKPLVNRDEGYLVQDVPHRNMYMRKKAAGYNGTLIKTFSMRNTSEKSTGDGGNFPAMIFRSNADMTAYYQLAVDPGATQNLSAAPHFYLCYCTEYSCFETGKIGTKPYTDANTGHCITEPIKGNMVFSTFESNNIFEVSVDLEGEEAHVVLSYHDDLSYSGKTTYTEHTFNLRDEKLKIPADVSINENDNVYIGFAVNKDNELLRNINWRSGGSCEDRSQMIPSVYCGFEQGIAGINTTVEPTRFVYDYCPEGGSCKCTYKYSLDGGNTWQSPPLNFTVPGKRYEFGQLQIQAECTEERGLVEPQSIRNACDGFVTFDPKIKGEICSESYEIYADGYVTYQSRDYIDPANSSQWISFGDTLYAADENLTKDVSNAASGISRKKGPLNPGIRYDNGKSKPMIGFACNYTGASEVCTNEGYLQLTDKISSSKNFLNLNGAVFSFDYILNWYTEKFIYWLEDVDGHQSEKINVSDTLNTWGYGDFANKRNPKTNSLQLVWNRDARGVPIYNTTKVNVNSICGTNNDCDPTKVSRLYFRLENNNRYGVHIMNLRSSCPNELRLENCRLNGKDASNTVEPLVISAEDAANVRFTALVNGATECEFSQNHNEPVACAGNLGDFEFSPLDLTDISGVATIKFTARNANDEVGCDMTVNVQKSEISSCTFTDESGNSLDEVPVGKTVRFSATITNPSALDNCNLSVNSQSGASCSLTENSAGSGIYTVFSSIALSGEGYYTPVVSLNGRKYQCQQPVTVKVDEGDWTAPQTGSLCLGSNSGGWPQLDYIAPGEYTVNHDCRGQNSYSFFYKCSSKDDVIIYGGRRLNCGDYNGQEIQQSTSAMPASGRTLKIISGSMAKFGCEIAGGSPTCGNTGTTITTTNSSSSVSGSSSSHDLGECEEIDQIVDQYNVNKTITGAFKDNCYKINTGKACKNIQVAYNKSTGSGKFTINGAQFECGDYHQVEVVPQTTMVIDMPSTCTLSEIYVYNCETPSVGDDLPPTVGNTICLNAQNGEAAVGGNDNDADITPKTYTWVHNCLADGGWWYACTGDKVIVNGIPYTCNGGADVWKAGSVPAKWTSITVPSGTVLNDLGCPQSNLLPADVCTSTEVIDMEYRITSCALNTENGQFSAVIENANSKTYNYNFVITDVLSNVVESEASESGSSSGKTFSKTYIPNGKYVYTLKLDNGSSCSKEWNVDGITADCQFVGDVETNETAMFRISNVQNQNPNDLLMDLRISGASTGTPISVNRYYTADKDVTAPSTAGEYTYILSYKGKEVCRAALTVTAPVEMLATCPALETYPSQYTGTIDFNVSGVPTTNVKMQVKIADVVKGENVNCNSNNIEYGCKFAVQAPSSVGDYTYYLYMDGVEKCHGSFKVKDVLNCSVDKTSINLGEYFTLTPNYSGSCDNYSLTGNGTTSGDCGSLEVTPGTSGVQNYTFTNQGSIGNGKCDFTVTVNSVPPTFTCPSDKTVSSGTNVAIEPTNIKNCSQGCTYTVTGGSANLTQTGNTTSGGSFNIGNVTELEAGYYTYTVAVSNSAGNASCNVAVTYNMTAPTFTCPSGKTVSSGTNVAIEPTNIKNCSQGCTYTVTGGSAPLNTTGNTTSGGSFNIGSVSESVTSDQTFNYTVAISNGAGTNETPCTVPVKYTAVAPTESADCWYSTTEVYVGEKIGFTAKNIKPADKNVDLKFEVDEVINEQHASFWTGNTYDRNQSHNKLSFTTPGAHTIKLSINGIEVCNQTITVNDLPSNVVSTDWKSYAPGQSYNLQTMNVSGPRSFKCRVTSTTSYERTVATANGKTLKIPSYNTVSNGTSDIADYTSFTLVVRSDAPSDLECALSY